MTTIAHKVLTTEASGAEVLVRPGITASSRRSAARKLLKLSWLISRDASAAAGLVGPEGGPVGLQLRIPWKRGVERLQATLIDGGCARELEVSEANAKWTLEEGLWHLDLPGLLRVSLREDPWLVLYARTDLLSALGVGGGRHELESADLVEPE